MFTAVAGHKSWPQANNDSPEKGIFMVAKEKQSLLICSDLTEENW